MLSNFFVITLLCRFGENDAPSDVMSHSPVSRIVFSTNVFRILVPFLWITYSIILQSFRFSFINWGQNNLILNGWSRCLVRNGMNDLRIYF